MNKSKYCGKSLQYRIFEMDIITFKNRKKENFAFNKNCDKT